MRTHFLCLSIWGCCLVGGAVMDLVADDEVAAAAALLQAKKTKRKGILKLARLTRSRDPVVAVRALVALGPACSGHDQRKLAARLEPYAAPTAANLAYPRIEGFAENARHQARTGQLTAAIHLLNKAVDECPAGLPGVVAKEGLGDCVRIPGENRKALLYYRDALGDGERFFRRRKISASDNEREPKKPNHDHWLRIRARLRRKIAAIERELRIARYGIDYVLYEEARTAHLAGKYETAVSCYDILDRRCGKSVYAEAGRFHRCLAQGRMRALIQATGASRIITGECRVKDTVKALRAFVRANPNGLYRGEALLELARLELTGNWHLDKAAEYYEKCIKWCRMVRRHDRALELFAVPAKSRTISKPPIDNQQRPYGVIIESVPLRAGKLTNRQTADWYLNEIEKQARYGVVFTLFTEGKWDEAKEVLAPVLDLDPHLRWAETEECASTYLRLQLCIRYRKIVLDDHELKGLPTACRRRVQYAEFIYLQRRFEEAVLLMHNLLADATRERRKSLAAVALYELAGFYLPTDEDHKSEVYLRRLIKQHPKAAVAARAHFSLGLILAAKSTDFAIHREALRCHQQARKLYPNSYLSKAAERRILLELTFLEREQEALKLAADLDPEARQAAEKEIREFAASLRELRALK